MNNKKRTIIVALFTSLVITAMVGALHFRGVFSNGTPAGTIEKGNVAEAEKTNISLTSNNNSVR